MHICYVVFKNHDNWSIKIVADRAINTDGIVTFYRNGSQISWMQLEDIERIDDDFIGVLYDCNLGWTDWRR